MVALLYAPDSRGNRLERYWVGMRPDRSEYYVHLHCADEIASQVRNVLRPLEVADCLRGQDVLEWTHRLSFSGPYTTLHRDLLELLTTVLTLPPVLELNLVLALDFHKVPPDLAAGRTDWGWTDTGRLVYRKYFKDSPAEQRRAGGALADRLTDVVTTHPLYRDAETIIAVPGTEHDFGQRLAGGVAVRCQKQLVTARRIATNRIRPAKEGEQSEVSFDCSELPKGATAIVVDDVYRSGRTMGRVALAAWSAGASNVVGLTATRTMRRQ